MNETIFTVVLIALEVIFVFFNLRARRGAGMTLRAVSMLGAGFVAWFGLAYTLLSQHVLSATAVPQLPFSGIIVFLIALGLLARRYWRPFRAAVDAMSTETFLSLQQMRLPFGVIFFLASGLPLWFQLIGGLGDMAAGIGAYMALRRLRKNPSRVNRAIIEGNLMGILDFVVVINLALFVVIKNQPAALDSMFNLIPLIGVPIFILLHIFSLQKLNQPQQMFARG